MTLVKAKMTNISHFLQSVGRSVSRCLVTPKEFLRNKLSITTQDFFIFFIGLKRKKEDYRQRGHYERVVGATCYE